MSYGPPRVDIYGVVRAALVGFWPGGVFSFSFGVGKYVEVWLIGAEQKAPAAFV